MPELLNNKVIAISGAGPGLGMGIAQACLEHGAAGIALGARTPDKVQHLAGLLQQSFPHAQVLAHHLDISQSSSCDAFVRAITNQWGRIDALFNNAYRGNDAPQLLPVNPSNWEEVFKVNVVGTQLLCQAAIPALINSPSPRIVNVTSMSAREANPAHGAYGASKATLGWVTRALATELAPRGIRVNALQPGWMLGPAVEAYFARTAEQTGRTPEEVKAQIVQNIALGYMPTDTEVAGTAVFLASDLSSPITGQILDVNGGNFY